MKRNRFKAFQPRSTVNGAPQFKHVAGDDQPQHPITCSSIGIPNGRVSTASRVRMKMADQPGPTVAHCPVRCKQGPGIDLECRGRITCDVVA